MKTVVMMLVSALFGGILLAMVMTIGGHMNRSVELQGSLSAAVEETVFHMMEEGGYTEETAIAECIESMAEAADSDSALEVEVHGIDCDKGVLSVRMREVYDHPNGEKGEKEWERTVIYDQLERPVEPSYEVCFYRSRDDMAGSIGCYKRFTVQKGCRVPSPAAPSDPGRTFAGWRDGNDYIADFSIPVTENRAYYADWT